MRAVIVAMLLFTSSIFCEAAVSSIPAEENSISPTPLSSPPPLPSTSTLPSTPSAPVSTTTPSNNETLFKKVTVDIYYTTWCRHSMNFLRNFFRPAYESIKDYATVKFIPLDHRFISRFLLCGLAALGDNQDAKVKFVTCDESNRKCAEAVNLSYQDVENCANGQEGRTLDSAADSEAESWGISFYPTIVFNKVKRTAEEPKESWLDFKKNFCNRFRLQNPDVFSTFAEKMGCSSN